MLTSGSCRIIRTWELMDELCLSFQAFSLTKLFLTMAYSYRGLEQRQTLIFSQLINLLNVMSKERPSIS